LGKLGERIDWLAARPGLWRRLPGIHEAPTPDDMTLLRNTAQAMSRAGLFSRQAWIVEKVENIRCIVTDLQNGLYRRRA